MQSPVRSGVDRPVHWERARLPKWLKRPLPAGNLDRLTERVLARLRLETVCANACCPNRPGCYARGVATFLILGNVCTRRCPFCSVGSGRPAEPAADEPLRVAEAAAALNLKHVVITSVTRDDLPDGGAEQFHRTIMAVRQRTEATVEVLTPDFRGSRAAIDTVLSADLHVYNHNVETVPRLYASVRPAASYRRSIELLRYVKLQRPQLLTKSGIMVGLGESWAELLDVLADLRAAGCDIVTIGQYLAPGPEYHPVRRYVTPDEFHDLERHARRIGFEYVAAGPFVRSSYFAEQAYEAAKSKAESRSGQLRSDPLACSAYRR